MASLADKKSIRGLVAVMKMKGYEIYDKPYQLNIVGVRTDSTTPNKFDDRMFVFWKNDEDKWEGKWYTVTTDPGTYYLKDKQLSDLGTAILKEGQYKDVYKIGPHGKTGYTALTQQGGKVTVYRDYNRDAVLDFNNGREESGFFGINIHRAGSKGTTKEVKDWSAGCQVFENADDFANFMSLVQKQKELYGNKFTYTLIDERAYKRGIRRRLVYVGVAAAVIAGVYIAYRLYTKKPIIPKF